MIVDDRMAGDIVAIPDFKSAENVYELFGRFKIPKSNSLGRYRVWIHYSV